MWKSFNNDFPKSIFISKDPVAIDSVMASITIKERKINKFKILSTEYLEDAMNNGLGIYMKMERMADLIRLGISK